MMAQVGDACIYEGLGDCYCSMPIPWIEVVILLSFAAVVLVYMPYRWRLAVACGALGAAIFQGVSYLFS